MSGPYPADAASGPGAVLAQPLADGPAAPPAAYRAFLDHLVDCAGCRGGAGRCPDGERLWRVYRDGRA